ncbi:hypothetical protein VTK56DRAFT_1475 [Thermocarpiscus australiensis]
MIHAMTYHRLMPGDGPPPFFGRRKAFPQSLRDTPHLFLLPSPALIFIQAAPPTRSLPRTSQRTLPNFGESRVLFTRPSRRPSPS